MAQRRQIRAARTCGNGEPGVGVQTGESSWSGCIPSPSHDMAATGVADSCVGMLGDSRAGTSSVPLELVAFSAMLRSITSSCSTAPGETGGDSGPWTFIHHAPFGIAAATSTAPAGQGFPVSSSIWSSAAGDWTRPLRSGVASMLLRRG